METSWASVGMELYHPMNIHTYMYMCIYMHKVYVYIIHIYIYTVHTRTYVQWSPISPIVHTHVHEERLGNILEN